MMISCSEWRSWGNGSALLGRLLLDGVAPLGTGRGLGRSRFERLFLSEVAENTSLDHPQPDVLVGLDDQLVVTDRNHGADDAARRDHLVVLLGVADHALAITF